MQQRHYPPTEYTRTEGAPLPIARLVEIWRGLHERERLGFLHSLDERLADQVLILTTPAQPAEGNQRNAH